MEFQKAVESGEKVIVGVNRYTSDEKANIPLLKIDENVEKAQLGRIAETKKNRDNAKVAACLGRIRDTAKSSENLMPPIIEAVREYALLGEVRDALVEVFGEYEDPGIF
jgi:methylmalonyl-CoA mutase N-terminal domain/subunit